MNLNILDWTIVALYFAFLLIIGFKSNKKNGDSDEDYLLAGRKITLPFFVASLVATWYGNILGVGEFVYNQGLVAWTCFALPYYIAAALFAIFIAKKARNSSSKSIPERIKEKFGKKAGLISSVMILIITIPAAYILMMGGLIKIFVDIPLWSAVLIAALSSTVFLFKGGLKSDIITNSFQFVLMYIGFFALFIFAILHFGSLSDMSARLPANSLSLTGSESWQVLFVWFIIALQTFIDPSFYQRCAAAKSPKTAQNGIWVSIACWAVFDFLTFSTGLYAKAYLPNLAIPMLSYPLLADLILPNFWKGIFLVALLAIIMSTLQSYAFLSASTIGGDILGAFKKNVSLKKLSQIGLFISLVFSVILAFIIPSPVELIYKTASVAVPALLFPTLVSYIKNWQVSEKNIIIANANFVFSSNYLDIIANI